MTSSIGASYHALDHADSFSSSSGAALSRVARRQSANHATQMKITSHVGHEFTNRSCNQEVSYRPYAILSVMPVPARCAIWPFSAFQGGSNDGYALSRGMPAVGVAMIFSKYLGSKSMRWMITAFALSVWSLLAMPALAQQSSRLSPGAHIARVNSVAFAYFVSGSGPVLIEQSPGWGIGSQYLQHGLKPLEKDLTLVSYDTRASGSSSRPHDESQMTTSNMVDDLEALRRYWGLPKINVLGHSHGGAIAIGYAIRYPERISKLILVDSSIQGFPGDDIAEREMKAREGDPRFATAIAEERSTAEIKTDKEMAESLAREMPLYFSDPGKNMAAFAQGLSQTPSAWVNAKTVFLDSSLNEEHQMHRVHADTLILVGRDDWIAGPSISEKIHAEIPQSQLKILEKTGHFPWAEDAAPDFIAAIENFMQQ
jgi:proline iminopeptidase